MPIHRITRKKPFVSCNLTLSVFVAYQLLLILPHAQNFCFCHIDPLRRIGATFELSWTHSAKWQNIMSAVSSYSKKRRSLGNIGGRWFVCLPEKEEYLPTLACVASDPLTTPLSKVLITHPFSIFFFCTNKQTMVNISLHFLTTDVTSM